MRHGLYRRPGKARVLCDVLDNNLDVLRLRSNKSLGVGAMTEIERLEKEWAKALTTLSEAWAATRDAKEAWDAAWDAEVKAQNASRLAWAALEKAEEEQSHE